MSYRTTDDWKLALTWVILPSGRAWQRAAGAALERSGLPMSAAATLLVLARLGDGIRQKDVAEEAVIDPAAIARSVAQLESQGLLVRQTDVRDGRAKTLHLTAAGREYAKRLELALDDFRTQLLAGITEEDGQAAVRVLAHLERASRCATA